MVLRFAGMFVLVAMGPFVRSVLKYVLTHAMCMNFPEHLFFEPIQLVVKSGIGSARIKGSCDWPKCHC